jgi:hypothetical protein
LGAQDVAKAFLKFVSPHRLDLRQFQPAPAGSGDRNSDDEEQDERERAEPDQRLTGVDRRRADHEKNVVHAALVADSALNSNEGGTFMVNTG